MSVARRKIEFVQPKPRIEDWRVKVNGQTLGLVWRCRDHYRVSVRTIVEMPTVEAAFKEARKQLKSLPTA